MLEKTYKLLHNCSKIQRVEATDINTWVQQVCENSKICTEIINLQKQLTWKSVQKLDSDIKRGGNSR